MDKNLLNASGCMDKTAYSAIHNVEVEHKKKVERDEAAEVLVKSIKNMIWLSGFKLVGRIQFEDRKSGKRYL